MKRFVSLALAAALALGSQAAVFADGAVETAAQETAVPTVELGLSDVTERMLTTGTAIETARINSRSDEALAEGYAENYDYIQMAADAVDAVGSVNLASMGMSSVVDLAEGNTKAIVEKTKAFAKDHLASNRQAELNSISLSAARTFYQLLQLQEYKKVAEENLKLAKDQQDVVNRKYKLGTASRLETMSAALKVRQAESSLATTAAQYGSAVMAFNLQLGYPLTQKSIMKAENSVTLVTAPALTLEQAIASAVENRQEVDQLKFAAEIQAINYNHAKLIYSTTSSSYMKQEVTYLQIMQAASLIESQMELDIRSRYADIEAKALAAESAQKAVEMAEESYRISKLSYDLGMSTLTDLQGAASTLDQAKIGRIAAVTDYNMAVKELEYAVGVGTSRISL